jgi:DNA-binding transcriptional regulator YiaG
VPKVQINIQGENMEKTIGEQIKDKRIAARLSHEQLAVAIGVTGQTIRNWEAGVYEPKVSDWEKLNMICNEDN